MEHGVYYQQLLEHKEDKMMVKIQRILFVEDDIDIQMVAELALQEVGGFTVKVCSSGKEALAEAASFAPDMMLLDVMMPGMNGIDTLKALKQLPQIADVPAIFMTAKVQTHEVEQYKAMGAIGVIAKPFDPMTLSDNIQQIWEKHSNER
jgi:CheY-like chemotaxis protein